MRRKLVAVFIFYAVLISCTEHPTPKKTGYYRIDLPKKEYRLIDSLSFSFEFELPQYAELNFERTKRDPNFFNIDFLPFGARIHMSYVPVDTNLPQLLEDTRKLVFEHTIKAQDIREKVYQNPSRDVYGILYSISGNAASSCQFFLTDSINYFLRGALYFNVTPNPDSLAPVSDFIEKDILHLIESFSWTQEQKDQQEKRGGSIPRLPTGKTHPTDARFPTGLEQN